MIPAWAGDYIGIPYSPVGRGPDTFDCYGLIQHIAMEQFGWDWGSYIEAYKGHGMSTSEDGLAAAMASGQWKPIEKKEVQAGDVVHLQHQQHLAHVAMMLDRNSFIHVAVDQDSVIDRLNNKVWVNRVLGFYRWTG